MSNKPSFMLPLKNGTYDPWHSTPTGNWCADNRTGRLYADELVEYMREHDDPAILGHVVKAIASKDHWGGVEVGFCHQLGKHLLYTK